MKNAVLRLLTSKVILLSFVFSGIFVCLSTDAFGQFSNTTDSGVSFPEGNSLFSIPKGQFVSIQVAISRLEAQCLSLKGQLTNMNPGSPEFKIIEWLYVYYSSILDFLNQGKSVNISIVSGLGIYETDVYGDIPANTKLENKNAAIQLLKQ